MTATSGVKVLGQRLPQHSVFGGARHARGSHSSVRVDQLRSSGRLGSGYPPAAPAAPTWKLLTIQQVARGLRTSVNRPLPPLGRKGKSAWAGASPSRRLYSYLPPSGSGGTIIVYGLVGLNVLGTLVWLVDSEGPLRRYMMRNLMVSTYSTLGQLNLHTLFTTNFSHSNIWNGAICSYMVYNVGSTAIQRLGPTRFLALYFLGGAFSQLCQVAGPIVAHSLPLPSILDVHPRYYTDGGFGATLSLLAWYCFMFPSSQVVLVVVPIQTGIAGALYLGATLYTVLTNGDNVPFLGGPPQEIWRTLGAVTAGGLFAFVTRGRGRYSFIKKF